MSFVNQYTNPNIAFNFAEEFLEQNDTFIYSLGTPASGSPIVMKSSIDGQTEWTKEINIQLQFKEVTFRKIVQVKQKGSDYYVIYVFADSRHILIGIDPSGNLLSVRQIAVNNTGTHGFIEAAADQLSYYFCYTDNDNYNGVVTPVIFNLSFNGAVINQRSLEGQGLKANGIIVKAMKAYADGVVLACDLSSKTPRGIILELGLSLNSQVIRLINSPSVSLQDILVNGKDDYIISAYDASIPGLIVSQVKGVGSMLYAEIPNTQDVSSILTFGKKDFHLFVNYQNHSVVHKFSSSLDITDSKQFNHNDKLFGVVSATYYAPLQHFAITTFTWTFLGRLTENLQSCITEAIGIEQTPKRELGVNDPQVEAKPSDWALTQHEGEAIDLRPDKTDVCSDGGLTIGDNAAIQSAHLYLQSAGSTGADSTQGIHLRWLLRGGLENHLPKADYATTTVNFNKADDFVRIYRAPYLQITNTVDLTSAPSLVNDANSEWLYTVGTDVFYVRFENTAQYANVRNSIDPSSNPQGFLSSYGNNVIEIGNETQLSFAATLSFTSGTSNVDLELLSVIENKITSPKKASLRQSYSANSLTGTQLLSENIRSVRFSAASVVLERIDFEFYSTYINTSQANGSWQYLGKHALTKDANLAFGRLEPQAGDVDGSWLRYNDDAYVRVQNYKDRWNSGSLPADEQIVTTVDKYINLSDVATNAQAIETFYFNDPSNPPLPGFDPSENEFELSNLHVLKLASLDYHIARMLGLGILDLDGVLHQNGRFMYIAEYISYGDLQDGLGAREVQHIYCSLPTAEADQRLPIPVDLKAPVPGIFQGLGIETPTLLTDDQGYSQDGKSRFLSLFNEDLPDEPENAAFFHSNYQFISSEGTVPVYAGIEYKLSSDPDWVKPELPYDKNYYNIDSTVPTDQTNETRSVLIPDPGFPVFVHREKQSGWHDYSSYGINWFSRATSSAVVHSIETVITPENLLQPPTNINAVLIRQESPLFLTSADEQVAYNANTNTDKTLVRLTFDYNHGQELIDYHKEINGEQIPAYAELPDSEELFAEDIDIYFRKNIPDSISGKVTSVVDDANPILSVVTTDEYVLAGPPADILQPDMSGMNDANFIGSALSINGANFIIHQIDNSGTYPVFTVFKNDADGFPVGLSTTIPAGDLTAPDSGGLFVLVENMLTPASWGTPNPLAFKVNIDHTTVHTETITITIPDGTVETHVQKFRGIYEDALIEKELEDDDGNSGTPDVHLGLYKITFNSYALADHSQAGTGAHNVNWYKGILRVHTDGNPNGERKALNVIRTENIGTTNNLVLYAVDPTFDSDPSYDQISIGTHTVNYYPGYRTYLYEDITYNLNEANTLPGPNDDIHYSIFGFRSNDDDLGYHSKISTPVLMYAQKIEPPLAPQVPEGGLYATRPDFFGKASYTFTNVYDHKPHAVQFGRASEVQIMTALWQKTDPDPSVWTVARIREEIFENGQNVWYNDHWSSALSFDYNYTSDPSNNGNFERIPDPSGVQLPLPNSETFIASINAFIDGHNDYLVHYNTINGTSISPVSNITSITSLYQSIIPATAASPALEIVDFVRDIIHSAFVPLTEIPVLYQHIKGTAYKPIPKKQVIRDENGNLLDPSHPDFDMAPMMKVLGTSPHKTQFTDFGIDGASNAKYFYVAREFSLQMKAGPHSPIKGPINLVNTAAPKSPEIVKVTPILENKAFNFHPQIEIEFNAYAKSQNIKKINVYRTLNPQHALSIRTMDLVAQIEVDEFVEEESIWKIQDDFSDLGYVPYGDPLFYLLTVSREVYYNDKNDNPVTEYQPSEPSKLTITNIVESYNPDSPELSYYSDPITPANELNTVTFKWPKTVHNGKYALQKRNAKGNWVTLKEVQSNEDEVILQLIDTDWGDDTLVVQDTDGNAVYHIFKIVATNFAGMISRDEKVLSIYDVNTWNDIATI